MLLRWAVVMGPAFLINEECSFPYALVWVIACLMVIVALGKSSRIQS
jgi:hypothetical protein